MTGLVRGGGRSGGSLGSAAVVLMTVVVGLGGAKGAAGQGLSDLDYEDLSLRGVMLDVGSVSSSRVQSTGSFGGRADLGFLGPGVRMVVGFNHWSSRLAGKEVRELEDRLASLIESETGEPQLVDLGSIRWSDISLHGDVHFLWNVPFGLLTYAGAGASAHVLRGSGEAIDDTFVDELLDSVRAGINLHAGLEVPINSRLRLVGETRYELLEDLSYFQFRVGGQLTWGALAPGEG